MKKNIIAMAVAAAVAAPAAAMADTTLYGKIHASYDVWGGDTVDNSDYSLASNSSRIGIKGKEAISDNLSLIYQWENGLDWGGKMDSGLGGETRNTFVGFTGGWGTAIAGRHDTPFKSLGRKYDLFGDTIGDTRAIIRGVGASSDTAGFDERLDNVVAYATPNLGGFHAMGAYVSNWSGDDASGATRINNEYDAFSVTAGYEIGGFMIDAGYEIHNTDGTAGAGTTDDESAYRVGAGYKIGGFKLVGLYQSISDLGFSDGTDVDMYGAGAAYSFGKSTIKGQYYAADDVDGMDDSDGELWAVGYDYKMSKQTSAYLAYGSMESGMNAGYELTKGTGHGERAAFNGEDSNAFSVGLVHKF
ncbi:MAG: porin [Halothiobacillaceae bacterium]|mgnify:CR=1 FL=1|nr:porin [Halothiobacillaceae bacterium]